jgi:hypothetical protein
MHPTITKHLSFLLALISVASLLLLGLVKNLDTSLGIVGIFSAYMGAKTAEKSSAHWAASKDPAANTAEVIEKVSGK